MTSTYPNTFRLSFGKIRLKSSIYNNSSFAWSQILFALIVLAAHANHQFYRFRTVFRVPYVIRSWYESRVRPVSPSDLVIQCPCERFACALVVFVLYSASFRHPFVIICLLSFKIHIRYSYQNFYSIFSVISVKLIGTDLFRINRGTTVLCTVQ